MKFNDTKRRDVCKILKLGGTRLLAANYVGITVETIQETALADPEFAEQLRKAELETELMLLRGIQAAAGDVKQWRASAWALERMYPERYARRQPDTITREQMTAVVQALGAVVAGEIPVEKLRGRVLTRLTQLIAESQTECGQDL